MVGRKKRQKQPRAVPNRQMTAMNLVRNGIRVNTEPQRFAEDQFKKLKASRGRLQMHEIVRFHET